MKKLSLCIFAFLFVLPFSACSEELPDELNLHIDSSYSAEYKGECAEGLLIYTPEGEMFLDVSTPDELYGLSYSWDSGFTIGYRGLNAITEDGYLPDSAFAQAMKNTFDDIRMRSPNPKIDENNRCFVSGRTTSGSYTVYVDAKGNITEVCIPELELNLRLK